VVELIGMKPDEKFKGKHFQKTKGESPLRRSFLLVSLLVVLTLSIQSPTAVQGQTSITPITINGNGDFGESASWGGNISSDGRWVVFSSSANNLSGSDQNQSAGIFLFDRQTGTMIPITEALPFDGTWGFDIEAILSGNGRFVFYRIIPHQSDDPVIPVFPTQTFVYDQLIGNTSPLLVNEAGGWIDADHLSTSDDGRFIAFPSIAESSPQEDGSSNFDLFIFDQLTGYLAQVPGGAQVQDPAVRHSIIQPKISGDGRFIVFWADANDSEKVDEENEEGIFIFNRVLNSIERGPIVTKAGFQELLIGPPDISDDGRYVAFLSSIDLASTVDGTRLGLYDTLLSSTVQIDIQAGVTSFKLSGDGRHIAFHRVANDGKISDLSVFDLQNGQSKTFPFEFLSLEDISADGQSILLQMEKEGTPQLFIWDERGKLPPSYILAGRVTDVTGHPLALATIADNRGNTTRTDGEGYFWFSGVNPGPVTLLPTKEGLTFQPASFTLDVDSDVIDLHIVYTHEETLLEATKDIGMPYSFNRGQNGPFHGFSAGYCTDLVLDAYTWGVDFNIQFALEQDFRAHPWHFYRWRDSRNAHDLWRYFSFTHQMQPHQNPYQPGDIVFFDWSEDGEIDHVALVSEVNSKFRPRKMIDATGVTNSNPAGLAAELPWEDFHERTVRGFARWSGKYEPVIPELPVGQVLQMALGGKGLEIRLLDSNGNAISGSENEIPGGRWNDWVWEQTFSIVDTFKAGDYYLVVVFNPGEQDHPYQFTAQWIEDGLIQGRAETKGKLPAGKVQLFPLVLKTGTNGQLEFQMITTSRRIEGVLKK